MNIHTQLPVSVSIWNRLRTELAEAYGLDEADEALPDTLDGIADLGDQIHALMQHACEQEMFAEALDKDIAVRRARKDRLLKASTAIRAACAEAARDAGIPRLTRHDMTLSFGLTKPSLAGDADPATLPDDLCRIKREVNRTAVRAAIDAGREVEGFRLSNGRPGVTVRRA